MEEEKRKAYSEVVEILKLIDDENRMEKIPFEVIELIKRNSDPEYKPTINKDKPIEDQNLKAETYSILGWIANKYWNEDIIIESKEDDKAAKNECIESREEKESINKTMNNIDEKASAYNDIDPNILEACSNQENLPVLKSEIKWYKKIKDKIIKLFKILFRTKDSTENVN